jgi:hypothetical protein
MQHVHPMFRTLFQTARLNRFLDRDGFALVTSTLERMDISSATLAMLCGHW